MDRHSGPRPFLQSFTRRRGGAAACVLGLTAALAAGCSREPPPASAPTAPALPLAPPRPRAQAPAALFKLDAPLAWPLLCFDGATQRFVNASDCAGLLPSAMTLRAERGTPLQIWRTGELGCRLPVSGPGAPLPPGQPDGPSVKVPLYRLVSSAEPDARAGTWSTLTAPRLFVPPSVPEPLVQTPGQRRGVLRAAHALLSPENQRRLRELRIDAVWMVDLDLDGVRERLDELTLLDGAGVPIGSGIFVTPGRSLEARPLRLLGTTAQHHRLIAAVDLDQDGSTELWIAREPVQLTGVGPTDVAPRIDEIGRYTGDGLVTLGQITCRAP